MKRLAAFLTAMTLAPLAVAGAQSTDANASRGNDDRAVVATVIRNAVTKVRLCALADEKSANTDVHALCRRASRDNARAAIDGMQLAKAIGATDAKLEPAPDTAEQLAALAQFSGPEFDREFLLKDIGANEDDEDMLRYAVEVAADRAVKRYEIGLLPNIQRERDLAESALRRVSESTP